MRPRCGIDISAGVDVEIRRHNIIIVLRARLFRSKYYKPHTDTGRRRRTIRLLGKSFKTRVYVKHSWIGPPRTPHDSSYNLLCYVEIDFVIYDLVVMRRGVGTCVLFGLTFRQYGGDSMCPPLIDVDHLQTCLLFPGSVYGIRRF